MANTRVHELAKEFGVEPSSIIAKLKEQGCFVKSASSKVPLSDEMQLRSAANAAAASSPGSDARAWFSAVGRPRSRQARPAPPSREPRRTSWDDSIFGPEEQQQWRQAGLGDDDARLAQDLLERGIWPADLQILLRGTAAVKRLRSGEASVHVLVDELLEARRAVVPPVQELPSRSVTRSRKSPPPAGATDSPTPS